MIGTDCDDASLVTASLAGDRDAFGEIVSRYQSLVCSVAYSATGSLSQSEDLAQETFLRAWKHLRELREPARLRSWLCGIARNCINNALRRQRREPATTAEPLHAASDSLASQPAPADEMISREEEAILWRSLQNIPQTYREPLIMFYREGESVESVARQLDLSEDAVKQRLSRGRRLLNEKVTSFVEAALKQSAPGKAFTIGVLTALPLLSASASTAAVVAATAKTSTKAAAGFTAVGAAILASLLAFFGTWVGYRMDLDSAKSDLERDLIRSFYRKLTLCIVGFGAVFTVLMLTAGSFLRARPSLFIGCLIAAVGAYFFAIVGLSIWSLRVRRDLKEAAAATRSSLAARPALEYRSGFHLLGLPFIHMRIGGGIAAQRGPVKAWIAIGDCAIGGLFAFGGLAVAPLSIGGFAIGLFPFGGLAVGLMALGGFSLGIWSFGGVAFGWLAYGGCALAWNAAAGGAAIAHDFALGGIAHAVQANNAAAQAYIQAQPFFQYAQIVIHYLPWINVIWLVPMLMWWRCVRRAKYRETVLQRFNK
jgi:RNA polymerase sigma factor (sigma-70 family)